MNRAFLPAPGKKSPLALAPVTPAMADPGGRDLELQKLVQEFDAHHEKLMKMVMGDMARGFVEARPDSERERTAKALKALAAKIAENPIISSQPLTKALRELSPAWEHSRGGPAKLSKREELSEEIRRQKARIKEDSNSAR